MPKKIILSIDGGGMRGIIPACLLARLEADLVKDAPERKARDVFSLIAGTSTGAVIAGGLAAGVPASRIVDLYVKRASEVFPQRPWNIVKRVFLGYVYSTKKLRKVLAEEAQTAASWKLNDCTQNDFLVTAKRVTDGLPWYFVKDSNRNSGLTGQLPFIDCITASAAAPTYFKPWTIRGKDKGKKVEEDLIFTDGGVGFEGNPVYVACVEAFDYMEGYTPEETIVVSLGTGRFAQPVKTPRFLWTWLQWIFRELMQSPGEQQTELVSSRFPEATLYRLDPDIHAFDPSVTKPIDEHSPNKRQMLRRVGEAFAATVDWNAILDGSETRFRVEPRVAQRKDGTGQPEKEVKKAWPDAKTLPVQYQAGGNRELPDR